MLRRTFLQVLGALPFAWLFGKWSTTGYGRDPQRIANICRKNKDHQGEFNEAKLTKFQEDSQPILYVQCDISGAWNDDHRDIEEDGYIWGMLWECHQKNILPVKVICKDQGHITKYERSGKPYKFVRTGLFLYGHRNKHMELKGSINRIHRNSEETVFSYKLRNNM